MVYEFSYNPIPLLCLWVIFSIAIDYHELVIEIQ